MIAEQAGAAETEESSLQVPALAELLGVSLVSGVVVIPLIMPFPKEDSGIDRALFAKLQINDESDKVVYDAIVPLDVVATFSLNLLKACNTAFENVGEIKDQDFLFVNLQDIRQLILEGADCLESLKNKLRERSLDEKKIHGQTES